jgi:hypothetical protein
MDDDIFELELKLTSTGVSMFMLANEVDATDPHPWWDQPSPNRTGLTIREEMRRLRDDLCRIEEGWTPGPSDLAKAPVLERWSIVQIDDEPLWRIEAKAYRFPGFRAGSEITSMQILAIDLNLTWARDRAHLYALGTPEDVSLS